jgi:hypothetical protein
MTGPSSPTPRLPDGFDLHLRGRRALKGNSEVVSGGGGEFT